MIEWTQTIGGECDTIEEVPKGATILSINDISCIGRCEGCGKPILEGDKYGSDDEGILVCAKCIEDI